MRGSLEGMSARGASWSGGSCNVLIVACALLSFGVEGSRAAELIVRPDGTGDFPTIQEAVNAAAEGDTVRLTAGVFTGTGNRDIRFFGKAILVAGASSALTRIDLAGELVRGFVFDAGETTKSQVSDLAIANGVHPDGGAVLVASASPTISRCTFEGNVGTYLGVGSGGAIHATLSQARFVDCRFLGNSAGTGGAVVVQGFATVELEGCDFVGNRAESGLGGAVLLSGVGDASIVDCLFADNESFTGGGGLGLVDCGTVSLSGSTFVGNHVFVGYTEDRDGDGGGAIRIDGGRG